MSAAPVFILGGHQTDIARNYAREGLEIADLVLDGVSGTLAAAEVEPGEIEAIHVGNAFGEMFVGQSHLGAMPATVEPAGDTPSERRGSACSSTRRSRSPEPPASIRLRALARSPHSTSAAARQRRSVLS